MNKYGQEKGVVEHQLRLAYSGKQRYSVAIARVSFESVLL